MATKSNLHATTVFQSTIASVLNSRDNPW